MEFILALFIFNQSFADSSWPKYGATLENTRYQVMRGKMDNTPVIKWSYQTGGLVESSPAVFDVNKDDTMDVIVGSTDTKVYSFNGITGLVQWSYPTGGSIWCSSPAAIDVDGDGIIEVIIGSENQKINCINGSTGTLKWQFSTRNSYISSPAIADIDTNGIMEIIVESNCAPLGTDTANVYCINGLTGLQKWVYKTRSYPSADVWISSPALADVDGDSIMEVFIGSKDSYVYCLNGMTGAQKWEYKTTGAISASPSVADIDNNDTLEVVIGNYSGRIYSLNARTGALKWSYNAVNLVWASTAVADLEGDGITEVLTGSRSGGSTLYCLNGTTGGLKWGHSMGVDVHRSISVADIDGDKKLEVIPSTYAVNAVSALNGEDGSVLWSKALISGTMDIHDVSIADIDGDGCVELLVGTAEKVLYALDDSLNSSNCGCMGLEEKWSEATSRLGGDQISNMEIRKNKICLFASNSINAELTIYDLCGRIKEVVYTGTLSKGDYTFTPNIKTNGIYFVRLSTICHSESAAGVEESNIFTETKKLTIIK